jgi:hypothetical protein
MSTLHIHSQPQPHEAARISGTREALEALQKALNQLISSGKSEKEVSIKVDCQDGECYNLVLQMKPSLEDDKLPYVSCDKWDGESV